MNARSEKRFPLEGIRIIDLSHMMAGPSCTLMLADQGAEVIKVEPPGRGELSRSVGNVYVGGESTVYLSLNRNKKSLTLDLKHPKGKEVLLKLVKTADVFMENMRPGAIDRLGLGYEDLRKINARLVYCSISGFGQKGRYAHKTAMDGVVQAMAGVMSVTGEEDGGPCRAGVNIGDIMGGLMAVQGILMALLSRERTGVGQKVETSLFYATMPALLPREGEFFVTGELVPRRGSAMPNMEPCRALKTKDGKYALIYVFNESFWQNLARALDHEEWTADPRFKTNSDRVRNRKELVAILEKEFARRTRDEILKLLDEGDVPSAPVYDFRELFSDPQVVEDEMVIELPHPTVGPYKTVGNPLWFSNAPRARKNPPPLLGQHTEELLAEIGYSEEEIKALKAEKII
ncbi:MAG: CoA transferase [Deltaproteobacteria bacterium]|nr:CoA transferase [Deltaproteobacteria bacterium]